MEPWVREWQRERFEDMINGCLRCHKEPYETESTHWHYCNDCVKVCCVCGELKVLWAFNFDFKSAEYKRWHDAKGYGFMNASGHSDTCAQCERSALEAILFKPKAEPGKISQSQLELMLKATLSKQAATEPPSALVEGQLDLPTE